MAVIQDLPAEIFRRILELGAEDLNCFKGRDLCSTALVARAWRQPSQELLVFEWWCPRIPGAPEYTTRPPARQLRAIVLDSPDTAAKARRLVERHATRLVAISAGGELSAIEITFFLEHGARAFSISGDVWDTLVLPDGIQLALESLWLEPFSHSVSPAFLSELFKKAPRLTRLELFDNEIITLFTRDMQIPLLILAPQLRHVTISFPASTDNGLDYVALLQACHSLRTFELLDVRPGTLCHFLSSIPSRLVLLRNDFNVTHPDGDKQVGKELLSALALPGLADLKRWRWECRGVWKGQVQVPHQEGVVESWEAACRARGIEPRSHERYYTD